MPNWEKDIATMAYLKSFINELDTENIWPYFLPKKGAEPNRINEFEKKINFTLPAQYKNFLALANGWPAIYQKVDLLGIDDYTDQAQNSKINSICSQLEPASWKSKEKIVIGISQDDMDVFILNLIDGSVEWYAGSLVDRFNDFHKFFLALMDYNKEEIADLKKERGVPQ